MEREPEVAVCYGADTIRGGSYLHAGARSSPAAERAECVQKAVLRDVLIAIRMLNCTPGHCVLARPPPCAIGSVLPAGPVYTTGASRDSKGHEGAYACRVAAHPARCGDADMGWHDLHADVVRARLRLPEAPGPSPFQEGAHCTRRERVIRNRRARRVAAKKDGMVGGLSDDLSHVVAG